MISLLTAQQASIWFGLSALTQTLTGFAYPPNIMGKT